MKFPSALGCSAAPRVAPVDAGGLFPSSPGSTLERDGGSATPLSTHLSPQSLGKLTLVPIQSLLLAGPSPITSRVL